LVPNTPDIFDYQRDRFNKLVVLLGVWVAASTSAADDLYPLGDQIEEFIYLATALLTTLRHDSK
jgi:hypothetical protein